MWVVIADACDLAARRHNDRMGWRADDDNVHVDDDDGDGDDDNGIAVALPVAFDPNGIADPNGLQYRVIGVDLDNHVENDDDVAINLFDWTLDDDNHSVVIIVFYGQLIAGRIRSGN